MNTNSTYRKKEKFTFKGTKIHDLIGLESKLRQAYTDWEIKDNNLTRINLYTSINDLSVAILEVNKYKNSINNIHEVAYEYTYYLFDRILSKRFVPKVIKDRIPWQRYISLNIRHIISAVKKKDFNERMELYEDLEYLVDYSNRKDIDKDSVYWENIKLNTVDTFDNVDKIFDKHELAKKLYKAIKIYYTEEEICRLLPLSLELLSNGKFNPSNDIPLDLLDFTNILICVSKRLINDSGFISDYSISNKNLLNVVPSAIRSTIFLASVVNSNFFPKELLLALDMNSLYRLVQIKGGKKVRIPTQKELDTLIGSVVSVSKVILDGKNLKSSIRNTRDEYNLVFSDKVNINNFTSKIIDSIGIYGRDKKTLPMIDTIVVSMKSVERLLDLYLKNIDNADITQIVDSYSELMDSTNSIMENWLKLKSLVEEKKSKTQ